jgi:hypothetical protein
VEHAFIDASADADPVGRGGIDHHLHFAGGDVGDASVEGERHFGLVADVVDEFVPAGVAGPFEAAADHPFVEALEPAEAAAVLEVDVGGVDHLLHRGIPAEPDIGAGGVEDSHAAGGDDGEGEGAIVDDDDIDAFLTSAVEGHLSDAPGGGGQPEVAVGEGPLFRADAACGAGQDMAERFCGWDGGGERGEHGGGEGDEGGGGLHGWGGRGLGFRGGRRILQVRSGSRWLPCLRCAKKSFSPFVSGLGLTYCPRA